MAELEDLVSLSLDLSQNDMNSELPFLFKELNKLKKLEKLRLNLNCNSIDTNKIFCSTSVSNEFLYLPHLNYLSLNLSRINIDKYNI